MRYPTPRTILFELSTHGSSTTRTEALRLLALPSLPDRLGPYRRKSRESLLRRFICDRRKSAKARLAAFKDLVFGLTMAEQDALERYRKGER